MIMANKSFISILILFLVLINVVTATGLSITLKRTNPGIVGVKSAELIFDVVNTDMDNKISGFILCRSPDGVFITSSLGFGEGSGAQYISPKFEIDSAPSQKAVYFSTLSDYAGDYNTNCILKYIPFKDIDGKRIYIKMNLDQTQTIKDSDYREIRLDKSVPFVKLEEYTIAYCPSGKQSCTSGEVILDGLRQSSNLYLYLLFTSLIAIIAMLLFILKRK